MRRNGQNSTSGQIFNPKFEIPMGCFLFAKIYTCFEQKTAFVMQNFQNLGAGGGGMTIFWKKPKRHILGWFHAFWAIMRANPFRGFFCMAWPRKKGHYKNSQIGYISLIFGEFPTQPNLTKIGIWVGVADVMNHTKFSKDWSREYYGGSNFGLLRRNGLSPITL